MTDPAAVPDLSGGAAILRVRAEAEVEAAPDIVIFSICVSARARDRREALGNLTQRNDEFLAMVRSFGEAIEKLQTSAVSVYPELRRGREEKVRWYRGKVRTQVTIADLPVAGELLGRVSDLELCSVDGPWWRLRARSPVYQEARSAAARAAMARAAEYAEAVGGRVTGLLELTDTGMSDSRRPLAFSAAAPRLPRQPDDEPPVLDLEPESQVVRASVEARFTMTQPGSLRG